ncbi:N-alpha-acetyltransferase MAK3 [Spatholobus suberectus]|nr:N-alpha-acetyltransferase MAK3 [Spatholobus suberectus]
MPSISTILAPQFQSSFFRACPTRHKCPPRIAASWTMTMDSDFLNKKKKKKKKEVSVQLSSLTPPFSRVETVRFCDLHFDGLQPSDQELDPHDRFEFGNFVARPALLDQEYWIAAWLRAESEWENRTPTRYSDQCKRKFADQEFHAIKKRCKEQNGDSSTCIITVRKERKNVKRTIVKSVVGTLDLNIRYLRLGETFPGELVEAPRFCNINRSPSGRYGYIANLVVAKSFRRKGIASNMLYFAVKSAKSIGVASVYAHVDRNNKPALILYQNLGFGVVEMANPLLLENQTYLLRLQM